MYAHVCVFVQGRDKNSSLSDKYAHFKTPNILPFLSLTTVAFFVTILGSVEYLSIYFSLIMCFKIAWLTVYLQIMDN